MWIVNIHLPSLHSKLSPNCCSLIHFPHGPLPTTGPWTEESQRSQLYRGIPIQIAPCSKHRVGFHPLNTGEAGEELQTARLCTLKVSRRGKETYDLQSFLKVEAGSVPGIAELFKKYLFSAVKNWTTNSICTFLAFWVCMWKIQTHQDCTVKYFTAFGKVWTNCNLRTSGNWERHDYFFPLGFFSRKLDRTVRGHSFIVTIEVNNDILGPRVWKHRDVLWWSVTLLCELKVDSKELPKSERLSATSPSSLGEQLSRASSVPAFSKPSVILLGGLGIAGVEMTGCQAGHTDCGNFCNEGKVKLCGQELNLVILCRKKVL